MLLANVIGCFTYGKEIHLDCSWYKKAPYGEYQFSPAKKSVKYDIVPDEIPKDILLMKVMGIRACRDELYVDVAEWISTTTSD